MKKLVLVAGAMLALSGCAQFSAKLVAFDAKVNKYAPIIGKDLIMVADILVTAECSPATASGSVVASNILKIVAPNSRAASNVQNALVTNQAIADQLCPFVSAIKAGVGSIPSGNPSQVIAIPAGG